MGVQCRQAEGQAPKRQGTLKIEKKVVDKPDSL